MPSRIRPRAVVSACMCPDGTPVFALNTISLTEDEADNGLQFYLAEGQLLQAGYRAPFVHFEESELPPSLRAALRRSLKTLAGRLTSSTPVFKEIAE